MAKKNGNTEPKTEYGLLVTIDDDMNYAGHAYNVFKAIVVELKDYGDIEYLSYYHDLACLTLRAQQSTNYTGASASEPYYDASYTNITLDTATRYVKTLTKLSNYLEREVKTRGSAQDYAEHAVRFALALGIKTIVQKTPSSNSGYPYRYWSLGDGAYWLRRAAQEWAEKYGKVAQTV